MDKQKKNVYLAGSIAFVIGIVWGVFIALEQTQPPQEIVFIHTNDTHSHIEASIEDGATTATGGVVRRLAFIDSVRAAQPYTFLIDAGDFCQGTPYFNMYKGEVEIEMMNQLGYDVATIGNHEFDNGVEQLAKILQKAKFDMVCTNIEIENPDLAAIVKPYVIRQVKGSKIAFMGAFPDPDGLVAKSKYEGVTYLDPITSLNQCAELLKQEGADFIVLVSHLGHSGDVKLAKASRNIDLIMGGHSHTTLETPDRIANLDGQEVVIGQSGGNGAKVGCMTLFTQTDSIAGGLFTLGERWDRDPNTQLTATIAHYKTTMDSIVNGVIGVADGELSRDYPVYPLVALGSDMLVAEANKKAGAPVDFGLLNTGGVRASIDAGDITLGEIISAFPFENHLSIVTLKGEDVTEMFSTQYRNGTMVSQEVQLDFNTDGVITKLTIKGKPVEKNRLYHIATIDYIAEGNNGLEVLLKATERNDLHILMRDLVREYVDSIDQIGQTIVAPTHCRIERPF